MSQNAQNLYKQLSSLSRRATLLEGISRLLGWDQETYMPEKASHIRAEQQELLAELAHSVKTGSEFEQTLISLDRLHTELEDPQKAAVRVWRRDFDREKKLPTSFVQEFTLLTSEAQLIWQKARANDDFSAFEPTLCRIVDMVRKKADLLGFNEHPYDPLLDEYEPGCSTKQVFQVFSELKREIVELLEKRPENTHFELAAPQQDQLALSRDILQMIGFDFQAGRLDLSAHPFSTSYHPLDSRLTTRTESHGIVTQVLTILHEAGHSFYDMGRPIEQQGTPLGDPVSYGIHESQSRFWETRIGRSLPFWQYLFPTLQKRFPQALQNLSCEELYEKINTVSPSLIRTDADEVTYPLHVILRFEIEKELITGTLKVKELPERWNQAMKELLGVTPPNNALGCLQDIHWSMGAFGYFPTYSLGNLYAAHLFEAFREQFPDWEDRVRSGQFLFIKEWLSKTVWQHGRRYDGPELIERICGKKLSPQPFISYLKEKYAPVHIRQK